MALEDGVGLEGVLLRADEVAGAEERRQQLGGRDERLERRSYRGRRSRDVLAGPLLNADAAVEEDVGAEGEVNAVDAVGKEVGVAGAEEELPLGDDVDGAVDGGEDDGEDDVVAAEVNGDVVDVLGGRGQEVLGAKVEEVKVTFGLITILRKPTASASTNRNLCFEI